MGGVAMAIGLKQSEFSSPNHAQLKRTEHSDDSALVASYIQQYTNTGKKEESSGDLMFTQVPPFNNHLT